MLPPLPLPSNKFASLAGNYFALLGKELPVCCLSDEFHFMPRAEQARFHLGRTDCLDREHLNELCRQVKTARQELSLLSSSEDPGLVGILAQSMDSFVLYWDTLGAWHQDPTLYLKVSWIGLDLALGWPSGNQREREEIFRARLQAIPRLLHWGEAQLKDVPQPARQASLEMVEICQDFLTRAVANGRPAAPTGAHRRHEAANKATEALIRFRGFLQNLEPCPPFSAGPTLFKEILAKGYGWTVSHGQTMELLREEASRAETELASLAREIGPQGGWQEIYENIRVPEEGLSNPVLLYQKEVSRLESLLHDKELLPLPPRGSVRVEPTPSFLEPIRATASYSAPPFPEAAAQGGRFFVEGVGPDGSHRESRSLMESLHRDYRYLTAHETLPGHHTLDWARLHHQDPVRRQIESAIFYEGWACYAEQLVHEISQDPDPRQRLIMVRRQLWRAVRGQIDAGLQTGSVTLEQGARRLESMGYRPEAACKQARRFTLTPGYQLCYTLGRHSFQELRRRFVPPLSLKTFHSAALAVGQVPFECLDQTLAALMIPTCS